MGTELYEDSAAPLSPERSSAGLVLILLVGLAVGGWIGWEYYENYQASCRAHADAEEADVAASAALEYILRTRAATRPAVERPAAAPPSMPSAPRPTGGVIYDQGRVAGWIGPAGSLPRKLVVERRNASPEIPASSPRAVPTHPAGP